MFPNAVHSCITFSPPASLRFCLQSLIGWSLGLPPLLRLFLLRVCRCSLTLAHRRGRWVSELGGWVLFNCGIFILNVIFLQEEHASPGRVGSDAGTHATPHREDGHGHVCVSRQRTLLEENVQKQTDGETERGKPDPRMEVEVTNGS